MKLTLQNLFLILLFACSSSMFASTYYVNLNATGTGTGTSWENAFTTIDAALGVAIVGDEVWVAAGTYKSTNSTYVIPNGIKLYGSFAGTETAVDQRDLAANVTTLNGDIGGTTSNADNTSVVVSMTNSSNLTRLDGFRIINGYNNGGDLEDGGSGLRMSNCSATIANCTFLINYSKIRGGAVHVHLNGTPVFINCEFSNNTTGSLTSSNGGAMFINSGTVRLLGCRFMDNSTAGVGGAICAMGGTVTLDRCYISGNTGTDGAGGIYIGDGATFNIYNTAIVGNAANATAGVAIYMSTTFNTNSHKIINCTIAHNKSNINSTSTAVHANNTTDVKNCIIWGNSSTHQLYCVPPTIVPNVDNTIIQGTYPDTNATGILNSDPMFVAPGNADEAPFNHTGFDYRVQEGSIAANTGLNTDVNTTYNKDILGNERIQVGVVDRGAFESPYEASVQSLTVATLNNAAPVITTPQGTLQLIATVNPAGVNQDVVWTVTPQDVVSVDENGLVTPLSNGVATITATSVADPSFTATMQVMVDIATAGLNHIDSVAFTVYPNPTSGLIEVVAAANVEEVLVYNMVGQQIGAFKGNNIDISGAAAGVYMIQIKVEGNKTATGKFVKK